MSDAEARWRRWLSSVPVAVLVAAAVLVPRCVLVARATAETYDEQYHLSRGLATLEGRTFQDYRSDLPLGDVLCALPLWAAGATLDGPLTSPLVDPSNAAQRDSVLYGQPRSPEVLRQWVAAWKALLFLPAVAVAFAWGRRLYGVGAAWLAVVILCFEPTAAAMVPIASLDALAMAAALGAMWCGWRWAERPTGGRLVAAAAAVAVAMAVKTTLVIAPLVVVAMAVVCQVRRRCAGDTHRVTWRELAGRTMLGAVLTLGFLWASTGFDISRPADAGPVYPTSYDGGFNFTADVVNANLDRRWPLGVWVGSLVMTAQHAAEGHMGMLLGGYSRRGWWYYFPVVALYKVPFGAWLVGLLGVASLARRGFRFAEVGPLLPAAAWGAMLLTGPIDIGFRHALPCYGFLILLACRCVATGAGPLWKASAWAAAAWAAVGVSLWHPDYLPYLNHRWLNPQLEISDSNLDWGQSLPEVREWLDARPDHPTPVYLLYFGNPGNVSVAHYLGGRVKLVEPNEPIPRSGLLIASPVEVAGVYAVRRGVVELWGEKPVAMIGRTMLVYDLNAITWRPQAKSHPRQPPGFRWPIVAYDRGVRGAERDPLWLTP